MLDTNQSLGSNGLLNLGTVQPLRPITTRITNNRPSRQYYVDKRRFSSTNNICISTFNLSGIANCSSASENLNRNVNESSIPVRVTQRSVTQTNRSLGRNKNNTIPVCKMRIPSNKCHPRL